MQRILALIALVTCGLFTTVATAADIQITCTAPTSYTDNTAIPAGTAITYTLYGGLQGASKTKLATAATCSFLRANVASGTQEYYITASVAGVESAPSATTSKAVPLPDSDGDGVPDATDACPAVKGTLANGCNPMVPKPPATVVLELVAYEVRPNSSGVMVASRIGLVPAGTQCADEARTANSVTYKRIDPAGVDLINWPAKIPPKDVFARCG